MHALVVGIAYLQPCRNLFRRPVQHQFTGHDRPQCLVVGKKTYLGSKSRIPSLMICFTGSIEWTPAMTRHLRLTVDTGRCNPLAISRIDEPEAIPLEISSHRASVRVLGERRRTARSSPPRGV